MTGAAHIQMQQFQVARLAAPAALTLAQLQALGGPLPLSATLLANPALLLRALDALHRTTAFEAAMPLSARLAAVDTGWLDTLIRRSALHVALQDPPSNHAFLLRHWYLSRRLSLLAYALAQASGYADLTSAACCGVLLRAGMLVFEQQQSAEYAAATTGAWQQQSQLAAERELFQSDHVEAGARLLGGWNLDQFSVDALRYQAEPLAQVLDAAPLVKICWYANMLTDNATTAALRAGRDLLGLSADQVHDVLDRVQHALDIESAALGVPELRNTVDNGDLAHEERQKLQLLRGEISMANMLAQYANGDSGALDLRLARLLQDAGIEPVFIVLDYADEQLLEVRCSHRVRPDPAGLSLVCAAGRNALSALILKGEAGVLTADTGLSVVDRQLLGLLGGQTILCEPLNDGNRAAVLLLGMNANAVTAYLAQTTLRKFIARLLLAPRATATAEAVTTAQLQHRIREAVHEANNPLAIIKNYLYIHGMKQGGGVLPEEIQLVRAEIDRVAAVLSSLRNPDSVKAPQKISVNKLVTTMHQLFADSFNTDGKRIKVELQLADADAVVFAREHALKQILTNLVKNAAEAIPREGRITLATQRRIYLRDKFFAQISVRDNGPGIAPELMARLFKPGNSTKGAEHAGSGLGIVRRLVEELGGQIGCRSDSNGTAMDILLPLVE